MNFYRVAKKWMDGFVTTLLKTASVPPWRRLFKRKGLKGEFRLHDLRHSLIADLAPKGFDIKTIMDITGHRDMTTLVQRYTHPTLEHNKNAVKALDAVYTNLTTIKKLD
jgi:integrase